MSYIYHFWLAVDRRFSCCCHFRYLIFVVSINRCATIILALAVSASLAVSIGAPAEDGKNQPQQQQQQQQPLQQQLQHERMEQQKRHDRAEKQMRHEDGGQRAEQEPSMAGTSVVAAHSKKHSRPDRIVFVAEAKDQRLQRGSDGSGLLKTGLISLLGAIGAPKKLLTAVIGYVIGKLKQLNIKHLLKTTLVGALVTVLGAIAAVAVAGLVSLVSGICAVLPYIKLIFGGQSDASDSSSHMDSVTEFVLGSFNKYDEEHKA